jgi:excisionase family DNA binding protein
LETSLSATAEPPAIDRWLTPKQAGEYLGYSAWTIRDLCKRSLLKHSRAPGGYRFRREWLDAFLEARAVEPKSAMVAPKRKSAAREESFAVDDELAEAIRKAQSKLARAK